MILLDEIDALEKDSKLSLKRSKSRVESLPPYSSGEFPVRPLLSVVSLSSTSSRSSTSTSPSTNHPRSVSLSTLAVSHATASTSTSTLVPPPSPSPTSPLFHLHRRAPPQHLRASNSVYIEREAAGITDPFVIDPLLDVPDCLLPEGIAGREQRCNLSLVTKTGDVCTDIWVREGSAFRSRKSWWDMSSEGDDDDYWADGWTYRSPPSPTERVTQRATAIEARTGKGSICLKLHTQLHQRLRIRISSVDGSIAVAIPRGFTGYIYINHDSVAPVDCPATEAAGRLLPSVPRQPVHFSPEVQEVLKTESEQRRLAKGRYFVGMAADQIEAKENLDSLSIDSRTGTISVFFVNNPSFGLIKPDSTIFTKFMTKARS